MPESSEARVTARAGVDAEGRSDGAVVADPGESCEAETILPGDLHARPAGALAVAAARFMSSITLIADDKQADAKSVLSVMGIGATSGQRVAVRASGPDAPEAVAALIDILARPPR